MICKNKEEIENLQIAITGVEGVYRQGQLKATIKTSILWCEDEINYIVKKISELSTSIGYFDFTKEKHHKQLLQMEEQLKSDEKKFIELQTHLNWLKEKSLKTNVK